MIPIPLDIMRSANIEQNAPVNPVQSKNPLELPQLCVENASLPTSCLRLCGVMTLCDAREVAYCYLALKN